MKFSRTHSEPRCADGRRSGFTLAEVLAALAFMLIVIPVVVQGLQLSSRAGQLGVRKAAAARIADRVMQELVVTGEISSGNRSGTLREGGLEYRWQMMNESWLEADLDMVSVMVAFEVQGSEYDVRLTTLVDPTVTTTATTTTSSTQ